MAFGRWPFAVGVLLGFRGILFFYELEAGEPALEVSENLREGVEMRKVYHKVSVLYTNNTQNPCQTKTTARNCPTGGSVNFCAIMYITT